ncbi:MAG: hypothetical protein ABIJ61_02410, partial [bacterium]
DQSVAIVSEYRVQPLLRIRLDPSGEQKVQGLPASLEEGAAIWARRSDDGILKFVDLCQPGMRLDDIGLLNVAADQKPSGSFHLLCDQSGDCWLSLNLANARVLLRIRKLNLDLLRQRRHFWCELIDSDAVVKQEVHQVRLLDKGELSQLTSTASGGMTLRLAGERLSGHFATRPVAVGHRRGSLFSLAATKIEEPHDGLE